MNPRIPSPSIFSYGRSAPSSFGRLKMKKLLSGNCIGAARVKEIENAGNGAVELRRNPLIDLDRVIEGAGKRPVLDDGDTVLLRDLADAEGDQIDALGKDERRAALVALVLESDRVVGRVGDDHGRARHCGDHPPARPVFLQRAD